MLSGTRKPGQHEEGRDEGLAEDRRDLRPVERRPRRRAGTAARCGFGRDARDPEERVEDDEQRAEDERRLDEAEDAADDLVGEARLLEQRLRLVEALDDERERDRRRRRRPSRTRSCRCTRAENCVQFVAEEVAERLGQVRGEQEREQDRRRCRAGAGSCPGRSRARRTPMKYRTISRSTVLMLPRNSPRSTHAPP